MQVFTRILSQPHLYLFNLPDPIPRFTLPLRPEDQEPLIDLQALINEVYNRSGYDYFIDYQMNPLPPLSEADLAWLETLLHEEGVR